MWSTTTGALTNRTGNTAMDEFLVRAMLAGLAVALAAGPLGAFVVWRRMAYFGGALSHAALLGVALGLLLGVAPWAGVAVVVVVAALMLSGLTGVKGLSLDTLLGIVAHGALALGLIASALLVNVRVDLMAYLFGDILAVGWDDVAWLGLGALAIGLALAWLWQPLLNATVHAELAHVEGVDVRRMELLFMLLLALVVALAMKVVGILLVTSMLVVPAAAARAFTRTPEAMALIAIAIGALSVGLGLWGSFAVDAPAGPAIVVAATVLFGLSLVVKART